MAGEPLGGDTPTTTPPARPRSIRHRTERLKSAPVSAASPMHSELAAAFHVTAGLLAIGIAGLESETEHPLPIMLLGLGGVVGGLTDVRRRSVPPEWLRRLAFFSGPVIVTAMVLLAGADTAGRALFWLFCLMPLRAFLFYPWPWAVTMAAWSGGASAVTAFAFHVVGPAEWTAASVIGLVSSVGVSGLVYYAMDADWDPATEMLTRRGFDRALVARCLEADQGGRQFSLATLKVDPGLIGTGDQDPGADTAARRLADAWCAEVPASAQWARIADLEFAVLWVGDSAAFERYLEHVRTLVDWAPVAIGFTDHHRGDERVQVVTAAHEGRAHSARNGGRVCRAGPVETQLDELREALADGRIVAHYQPIVDLATGAVIGAEALARWKHAERGWVPPDEFIPMAEHANLIHALGEQILRQACRDAGAWRTSSGRPPEIAVNVSGRQLHDPTFPATVAAVLAASGLAPSQLTLEITESTVAADDPRVHAALNHLRAKGITVAIDDFGTGYSSAARLVTLPVDMLKIDREFVRQLDAGHPIVEYMVALAAGTGLRTVVEGIERADQAAAISAFGADYGQGWLFGRPVPNHAFPLSVGVTGEAADVDAVR